MKQSINIKGTLMDLSTPKVMGILNATPDSFYDGGEVSSVSKALKRMEDMVKEGADFIDIGGYSSRPGADEVSVQEELDRVLPIVEAAAKAIETYISVDTFRSQVAKAAIEAGGHIINDISAGEDDDQMIAAMAELKVPYIAMHKQGVPSTMQDGPEYDDVVLDVLMYLLEKKNQCFEAGITDLIIDVGFGFGKTMEHNFDLLNNLEIFKQLNVPMLAGLSRKSMIYKTLGVSANEALNGTSFLHGIALANGANILRVHDVKEAVECIKLFNML